MIGKYSAIAGVLMLALLCSFAAAEVTLGGAASANAQGGALSVVKVTGGNAEVSHGANVQAVANVQANGNAEAAEHAAGMQSGAQERAEHAASVQAGAKERGREDVDVQHKVNVESGVSFDGVVNSVVLVFTGVKKAFISVFAGVQTASPSPSASASASAMASASASPTVSASAGATHTITIMIDGVTKVVIRAFGDVRDFVVTGVGGSFHARGDKHGDNETNESFEEKEDANGHFEADENETAELNEGRGHVEAKGNEAAELNETATGQFRRMEVALGHLEKRGVNATFIATERAMLDADAKLFAKANTNEERRQVILQMNREWVEFKEAVRAQFGEGSEAEVGEKAG